MYWAIRSQFHHHPDLQAQFARLIGTAKNLSIRTTMVGSYNQHQVLTAWANVTIPQKQALKQMVQEILLPASSCLLMQVVAK